MGQVSDYVNGPYQGVSQAPQAVRLRGSCALMEDCVAVIPYGLQKRPPYEWRKRLVTGIANPHSYFGMIPRGSDAEDLFLIITEAAGVVTPRLFSYATLSAVTLTISAEAQAYLNAGTVPNEDLKAQSIEDVTFVSNRKVQVATSADVADSRPYEALVWVKASGYGRKTEVSVDPAGGSNVTATFATSTGGSASDANAIGTDRQAKALYDGTNPGGSAAVTGSPLNTLTSQGFTVTLLGSIIYLSHPTDDFTVAVKDDQGGASVVAIKGAVQRFSDLPSLAVDGFTVEIAQEANGGNSNYYVKFEAGAGSTHGVWREVIQPGAPLGLDPETMPVGIFLDGADWVCEVLDWKGRTTGNLALSPDPGFVGDYITDVKWWRGRLALTSLGQPVVLSASDDPYKFYTTTLATSLESDSLGFLNPADRKAFFHQSVTYDTKMFTFGASTGEGGVQTVLASDGPVTSSNASMNTHAEAAYHPSVPVQKSLASLFFATQRTSSIAIMEMSVDRISGLIIPTDATAAVPNYLPTTLDQAASYKTDYLSFYSSKGQSAVYVHAYRRTEEGRVQNAWWKWNSPSEFTTGGMLIRGTLLYTLLQDAAGALHLVQQELAPDHKDLGTNARCFLDMRLIEEDAPMSGVSGGNSIIIYPASLRPIREGLTLVVRGNAPDGYPIGSSVPILASDDATFILPGDFTGVDYYVGYEYDSRAVPNHWFVRGADENPQRQGRLTIRDLKLDLANAGFFQVTVQPKGKPSHTETFQGTLAYDEETPADVVPMAESVVLRVPVGAEAWTSTITFSSSSYLGFKLTGYEWTGDWNGRSRRLS